MDNNRGYIMSVNAGEPEVFLRQSSTRGNMEPLKPMRPFWHEIVSTIGICGFILLCILANH